MQDLDDEDRKQVLGEVLHDELKIIKEYLEDLPLIKQKVTKIQEDVEGLKSDMKVVKTILRERDTQLNTHEHRLARLETAGRLF